MGKLRVIKIGPLATIQDFGRFGYRKYGIPQSGAMDIEMMKDVNTLVGNPEDYPVIEFAMMSMRFEVEEDSKIAISGANFRINGNELPENIAGLQQGDIIDISIPEKVYAYMAMSGRIQAKEDFGSVSTYSLAGFGGINGGVLKKENIVSSIENQIEGKNIRKPAKSEETDIIRIMKGPEWNILDEALEEKTFNIHPSSNRMGIRLTGEKLQSKKTEIISSAVIPGIIQLPPDGYPIVLMNDCQTTGGYPRIAKVVNEDLGKLAQIKPGQQIMFVTD